MTQQKEGERVLIQAHDEPLVFSLPHLDELLREQTIGMADPRGLALVTDTMPADTQGWDTVFAIRPSDVNRAIQTQGTSPQSYSQVVSSGYSADGTFGTWQITGGSGAKIDMTVPIQTGSMTYQGQQYPMNGATVTIEVTFAYSPSVQSAPVEPTEEGTTHDLKVNTIADPQTGTTVNIEQIQFPEGEQPPTDIYYLMYGPLSQWFSNNIGAFDQVFATVNLNLKADNEGLQWLKPTYTSYAYANVDNDLSQSVFGILCMTGGDDPSKLTNDVSAAAIPDGQEASFLIGQQLFMRESVLPGLPSAFNSDNNVSITDFQLINEDAEAILADGSSIELDGVEYGAITYHPYLTSFDLVIDETEIVTNTTVQVQISPGIVAYFDTTTWNTLTLETKSDGVTQTIGYAQTRDPVVSHRVETATWVVVTEAIAATIAAVVGALIGGKVLTTMFQRVIIAIIVAVIGGIISAIQLVIEDVVANGVVNSMPSIDPLLQEATAPITWPTQQSDFALQNVALNGAVQLIGDPGFAS